MNAFKLNQMRSKHCNKCSFAFTLEFHEALVPSTICTSGGELFTKSDAICQGNEEHRSHR